jgi:hypothetical protein
MPHRDGGVAGSFPRGASVCFVGKWTWQIEYGARCNVQHERTTSKRFGALPSAVVSTFEQALVLGRHDRRMCACALDNSAHTGTVCPVYLVEDSDAPPMYTVRYGECVQRACESQSLCVTLDSCDPPALSAALSRCACIEPARATVYDV